MSEAQKHTTTGAMQEIAVDGVFVAIGHAPASELVKDKLDLHNQERLRKVQEQAKFQRRHDKLKQDLDIHKQEKHLKALDQ